LASLTPRINGHLAREQNAQNAQKPTKLPEPKKKKKWGGDQDKGFPKTLHVWRPFILDLKLCPTFIKKQTVLLTFLLFI